jgi:hypothetical protein
VALLYGALVGNPLGHRVGATILGSVLVASGILGYRTLRVLVGGLDKITLGAIFFVLALLISLRKARRSDYRITSRSTASKYFSREEADLLP